MKTFWSVILLLVLPITTSSQNVSTVSSNQENVNHTENLQSRDKQNQGNVSNASTNQLFGLKYYLAGGETVIKWGQAKNTNKIERKIWAKLKCRIVEEDDTFFIHFKPITKDPETLSSRTDYQSYVNTNNYSDTYYIVGDKRIERTYHYKALVTSALLLPIKIRFPVDSFSVQASPDVSVGPYIGIQWGQKTISQKRTIISAHSLVFFTAPGLIPINSSNTRDTSEKNSSAFGLSIGGGYLYEINKFQIGLFVGYDFVFGDAAKTWVYQPFINNQYPWISVGIGFNFRRDQ